MIGEARWNIDIDPRILAWHESCRIGKYSFYYGGS